MAGDKILYTTESNEIGCQFLTEKELSLCGGSLDWGGGVCECTSVTFFSVTIEVERGGKICITCVSLLSCANKYKKIK